MVPATALLQCCIFKFLGYPCVIPSTAQLDAGDAAMDTSSCTPILQHCPSTLCCFSLAVDCDKANGFGLAVPCDCCVTPRTLLRPAPRSCFWCFYGSLCRKATNAGPLTLAAAPGARRQARICAGHRPAGSPTADGDQLPWPHGDSQTDTKIMVSESDKHKL